MDPTRKRIFVSKIPKNSSKTELKRYFSRFGDVEIKTFTSKFKSKLPKISEIEVKSDLVYKNILSKCPHYFRPGVVIRVEKLLSGEGLKEKQKRSARRKISVFGIYGLVSEKKFKKVFNQFGEVDYCYLVYYKEKKMKAHGFVAFKDEESAKRALARGRIKVTRNYAKIKKFIYKDGGVEQAPSRVEVVAEEGVSEVRRASMVQEGGQRNGSEEEKGGSGESESPVGRLEEEVVVGQVLPLSQERWERSIPLSRRPNLVDKCIQTVQNEVGNMGVQVSLPFEGFDMNIYNKQKIKLPDFYPRNIKFNPSLARRQSRIRGPSRSYNDHLDQIRNYRSIERLRIEGYTYRPRVDSRGTMISILRLGWLGDRNHFEGNLKFNRKKYGLKKIDLSPAGQYFYDA